MALSRWNPWGELFTLHDQVDQLFNETFGRSVVPARGNGGGVVAHLPLDIRQSDEAFTIEASVPGFTPDEVEVTIDEGALTIRGEHRTNEETSRGGYVRRERQSASVYRQVGLPAEVRADEISATFANGVLTITVPRAQKAQPKRIPVTAASEQPQQRVIDAPPAQS
jgi:HSP20 family protein